MAYGHHARFEAGSGPYAVEIEVARATQALAEVTWGSVSPLERSVSACLQFHCEGSPGELKRMLSRVG
jgi:hypothetical protein